MGGASKSIVKGYLSFNWVGNKKRGGRGVVLFYSCILLGYKPQLWNTRLSRYGYL